MQPDLENLTVLLQKAAQGSKTAAEALMPIVYERLSAIAHRQLAKSRQWTLSTTGLVHEAYFELFGGRDLSWQDQNHFFAYAATTMRNLLINRAQSRLAQKRGGGAECADLADHEYHAGVEDECLQIVALDQILRKMAILRPRFVQIIEMRFFAGLSVEEVAKILAIDERTVKRDWQQARALIVGLLPD